MNRNRRILLFGSVLALLIALSGCSEVPDSVEDPLSAFNVDEVLPFATQAPDLLASTTTPAPTIPWQDATPTPNPLDWRNEKLPDQEEDYTDPTPEPTRAPTKASANDGEYYTIGYSDSGAAVWNLQERLQKLGYYNGIIDGDFGSGTESAVKRFQRAIGLSDTGVATAAVQERLYASTAPTYKPVSATPTPEAGYSTLKSGSSGSAVKRLQNRLKDLGYYTGSVDGNYGSGTVSAVKRFQKAVGLEETGTATAALQTRLFADNAPANANVTPAPTKAPASGGSGDSYKELKKGDSGSAVERLQNRLKDLGYYTGKVDGNYGSGTVSAIKLFEKAYGKKQTGVASTGLQKYLFADDARPNKKSEATAEPTSSAYKKLSPGDTGNRVKVLQKRLKELGYFDGDIGGNYLTKTTAAVKAFQKAVGVEETGVASVALQELLHSSDAPYASGSGGSTSYKELKKGSSGQAVKDLQTRLKDLGYYTGSVDGEYGASTVAAVKLFEKANGKKQTGVASAGMQKYLFAEDAKPYSDSGASADKDLKKGDSGQDVYRLQLRLIELGYLEDGGDSAKFDAATQSAVKAAQEAAGYNKNDGVAYASFVKWLYSDEGYSISLYEYGDGDVDFVEDDGDVDYID